MSHGELRQVPVTYSYEPFTSIWKITIYTGLTAGYLDAYMSSLFSFSGHHTSGTPIYHVLYIQIVCSFHAAQAILKLNKKNSGAQVHKIRLAVGVTMVQV